VPWRLYKQYRSRDMGPQYLVQAHSDPVVENTLSVLGAFVLLLDSHSTA